MTGDRIFEFRNMALEVAFLLNRITGDECAVVKATDKHGHLKWAVVRYDRAGKEFAV